MRIISGIVLLLVIASSSDKLLTFAENSQGIDRRSLSSGKCLVDNPSNAARPLCFIDGEQIDVCSNTGCGGCCGSQCSWIGTYCDEADGVVARCPGGWSQVGTLSANNDIGGAGLGQSQEDSIEDCKNLCLNNPKCVAFMYGGANTEGDSKLCELSGTVTPNNSWGTNFRFCRKKSVCLKENPEQPHRPLCFVNEVHHDTCSNKGCNGCCGSHCSWINSYCDDKVVAECPSGYQQIGTLSTNNDIRGAGLGQSQQDSIEDCQNLCEETDGCVAFMYGGFSALHDSKLCELASTATPDNSWGSNFRFCQMITEEPEAAIVDTIQFTTSGPGESCDKACGAIVGECIEEKLVLQSAEDVASWALAVGVTCTEIVDRCDIGESPIFNYSIWERKGLCTFCSKPEHPGWLSGNRCRAKYQIRERICPCATTIQIKKAEPEQHCDDACEAIGEECVEQKLVLQSAEEVLSWADAVGITCSEILDRCDIGDSPIFNYNHWGKENKCTFCGNPLHPGWLNGNRCGARWHHRERVCPCSSTPMETLQQSN